MATPGQSSSSDSEDEHFDPNFITETNCAGSFIKDSDDEKVCRLCHISFKENRLLDLAYSFYSDYSLRNRQLRQLQQDLELTLGVLAVRTVLMLPMTRFVI